MELDDNGMIMGSPLVIWWWIHLHVEPHLFGSKSHAFQSKMSLKINPSRDLFGSTTCGAMTKHMDIIQMLWEIIWVWVETWGTHGPTTTDAEDLQRYIFRGRRGTRDMFIRDVRRSGRWFPERGCILEDQIFSFGNMILCDRFVWPGLTFSWQAQYFRQMEWKNR